MLTKTKNIHKKKIKKKKRFENEKGEPRVARFPGLEVFFLTHQIFKHYIHTNQAERERGHFLPLMVPETPKRIWSRMLSDCGHFKVKQPALLARGYTRVQRCV